MNKQNLPADFNEVLEHINVLKQGRNMSWMDAILEYCDNNDIRIEEVGYLIKEQPSFLKIVERDFRENKFIRSTNSSKVVMNMLREWM